MAILKLIETRLDVRQNRLRFPFARGGSNYAKRDSRKRTLEFIGKLFDECLIDMTGSF